VGDRRLQHDPLGSRERGCRGLRRLGNLWLRLLRFGLRGLRLTVPALARIVLSRLSGAGKRGSVARLSLAGILGRGLVARGLRRRLLTGSGRLVCIL